MTAGTRHFSIRPQGPFSLREAALFGFGQRHATGFDGTMRLAFCVDGEGYLRQVGVALTQDNVTQEADEDDAGTVHGTVVGDADLDTVRAQVARVLSLDHDARAFAERAMFRSVTKIGTGLSDAEWQVVRECCAPFVSEHKPARVESAIVPSVWVPDPQTASSPARCASARAGSRRGAR
jgi:DNA-3-methyladenine glycosylase II